MPLSFSQTVARAAQTQTVRQLAEQVRALEVAARPAGCQTFSSGSAVLDRLLPDGGLRRGSLVEWLYPCGGSGAAALALRAARQAAVDGGVVVVIDPQGAFYPPAAFAQGMTNEQLVVVRPNNNADAIWAWDQALRSAAVAAVWGWPGDCDARALRRWQLAAEGSGAVGLLLRPQRVRGEPSWAELRLLVTPQVVPRAVGSGSRRRLHVCLLRARGGSTGGAVEITWSVPGEVSPLIEDVCDVNQSNLAIGRLHLAAQLAGATPAGRARRA